MSEQNQHRHHLLLFDFDHTVCDGNTDTWILNALPPLDAAKAGAAAANAAAVASPRARLPAALRSPAPGGWTAYMQRVFDYAHEQGVYAQDFRSALQSLPLTPGFPELLAALERATRGGGGGGGGCDGSGSSESGSSTIVRAGVISDSNSLFIPWTLEAHGIDAELLFSGAGVHTNPAALCAEGRRLSLSPHHAGPPHGCPSCPPNLCKTKRMRAILDDAAQVGYPPLPRPRIAYVGDGGNDACPARALSAGDVVFARRGMALDRLLSGAAGGDGDKATAAEVVRWDSGVEILEWLRANWGVLLGD